MHGLTATSGTELGENGRQRLKSRLPEHRLAIATATDDGFLELCEAYGLASAAIAHWSRSTQPERDERLREYHELVASLEKEAVEHLRGYRGG
ncbi:MAG: hypothetical protein J0J10_24535 [Bosea sp.]|jgi:acyl-CoA reductase-like NAD-dependent aldehyde dehydrogenase|uniref:hypothetical protein n=1 Tax=Bosea sp. (in: a-proteobacteria) TaxID=1871050 RepID=UPI001AC24E60|nr:hypothetical protein [Bosea sp. (in: a-proteobacteria)]MBN9471943.1 hypothetical protein [Bosea sp. (in: a-proteobacteria)]